MELTGITVAGMLSPNPWPLRSWPPTGPRVPRSSIWLDGWVDGAMAFHSSRINKLVDFLLTAEGNSSFFGMYCVHLAWLCLFVPLYIMKRWIHSHSCPAKGGTYLTKNLLQALSSSGLSSDKAFSICPHLLLPKTLPKHTRSEFEALHPSKASQNSFHCYHTPVFME